MASSTCNTTGPSESKDVTENGVVGRRKVRVYADGCCDLVHYAHLNLMRRSKALGDELVVGVHSDADIRGYKGPTVFTEEERYYLVRGVKWVDELVEAAPLRMTIEDPLNKHNCDFCVHGDDMAIVDGEDNHAPFKKVGRFREVKRTAGVSSTDIIARMLDIHRQDELSNGHHQNGLAETHEGEDATTAGNGVTNVRGEVYFNEKKRLSDFIPSSKLLADFARDQEEPKDTDRIVYCDGAFDLFHYGHLRFLEEARKKGDYLIVGVFSDETVAAYKGRPPVMNLHERVLTVLGYRPVSQVLIDPPYTLTKEFMDQFKIDNVCHGVVTKIRPDSQTRASPYAIAERLGKFCLVDSLSTLTNEVIFERVQNNRKAFLERNKKKGV